ncbi:MAG: aminoglycoside phosphotransferase family protein, partial [Rhizobiales bacterium]|nr:aminoglycoside phosphotransferase family protein [Hyphomicrobiales bacterium]
MTPAGEPGDARRDAILARFDAAPAALLAAGGESFVYALGPARVLRILRRPQDPAALHRKQAFLAGLDGRLPFATQRIEAIDPHGGWTVERRIPGESLLARLRTLGGPARQAALRHYAEAVDAVASVLMPERPYGQVLAEAPVTAPTWHAYLVAGLDGFIAANGAAVASLHGDVGALRARALDLLPGVAERPPKALVHGDYFPGNVMMDTAPAVTGLIDFSAWTTVGDPAYDAVGAVMFLEMMAETSAGYV